MPDRTDEEVAKLIQDGNSELFGLLMERYQQKMTRYARKFLFEGEDINDLVQEIFIKAYANIKSFDVDRKFSSWLYRIAHNEFINAMKKKMRTRLMTIDFDTVLPHLHAKEKTDDDLHRKELQGLLDRSLDKLNPRYREPLVLFYIEEMDYKEIAEILKIPISTVGIRLKRGKEQLKKIIPQ
jgi:RNA polymerase sigma-70 factor, ECF subfamily